MGYGGKEMRDVRCPFMGGKPCMGKDCVLALRGGECCFLMLADITDRLSEIDGALRSAL